MSSSSFPSNMGFDDDDDSYVVYQHSLGQSVMNDMLSANNALSSLDHQISDFFNIFTSGSDFNDFHLFNTTSDLEREVVDTTIRERDTDFIPSHHHSFYLNWADDTYDYEEYDDETLTEDVLRGLTDFHIDVPSSSSTSGSVNGKDHHFEFESLSGPAEYGEASDESFFQDFLSGLADNIDVDSSLIESIFGVRIKDGGGATFGTTNLERNKDENKLHQWGWVDESLINDILRAGGNDYATSALIDALFNYDENDYGFYVDSVSSKEEEEEKEDLKSFDKEEDDFYMVHRKDAIKAMRSALFHTKAAKDASVKGDHASARQYKLRAKEDWAMAKKLNAEAAKKILSIKNSKNDIWTLDLHGLHAREAVDAVRSRLQTIENSASLHDMNKLGKHKKICLRAITGRGNHSKGAAVLPIVVRKFLARNGYKFNDSRPGSFMIHPKFRALAE